MTLLLLTACATTLIRPADSLDWDLHPDLVEGEIRVAPVVVTAEAPEVELTGLIGERVDEDAARLRLERTAELAELPYAFQQEVPGALYGALPEDWNGRFRDQDLTLSQRFALAAALHEDGRGLSETLGAIARERGGAGTLFTWAVETRGQPLTSEHMAGELVLMSDGMPVMVDPDSQPYRVQAELGVALVSAQGEILFRYQDAYEGLLTDDNPLDDVASAMARQAVNDIAPLWLDVEGGSAVASK